MDKSLDGWPARPRNSNAILRHQPDGLLIELPRKGWWHAKHRFITLWCIVWCGMTALFTATFIPAFFAGKVEGDPWVGWVIMPVFWAFGLGFSLILWHRASRRGRIQLTDDRLEFEERSPFSRTSDQWSAREIRSITVGSKKYNRSGRYMPRNSYYWKNFITVRPSYYRGRQWFNNREKSELEWVVTVLRQELQLESKAASG